MLDRKIDYVLIDADIVAYRSASLAEAPDPFDGTPRKDIELEETIADAELELKRIFELFDAEEFILVWSPDNRTNFRKAVDKDYKANRNPKPKPDHYWPLVKHLRSTFNSVSVDGLEGDDMLGVMHTRSPNNTIIVSSDKDMKTIPGVIYNPMHDELHEISPNQANWFWMYQTLMGDSVDGYAGCPGIGKVKASAALPVVDELEDEPAFLERLWFEVLETYKQHYKNPDVAESCAIRQARLARILRNYDYDWSSQSIRLWHPTDDLFVPLSRLM